MENTRYYTANYTYTNPNFVIQNLQENLIQSEHLATFYIVKNLLQRGFPTMMSQFLQEKLGELHKKDNFDGKNSLVLIDTETPKWYNTIKGHDITNKFPAIDFLEKLIPQYLGEYAFVQSLILPEVLINDITEQETQDYVKQQVDFYLPQAKLVIEIDGGQHKEEVQTRLDNRRNQHLGNTFTTVRIETAHIKTQNATFISKIDDIKKRLSEFTEGLKYYQASYKKVQNNNFSQAEIQEKLLPTAIIRFQLLVLELLIHQKLSIEVKEWHLDLHLHKAESFLHDLRFAHLAIEDLFLWIENLCILRNVPFERPKVSIAKRDSNNFHYQQNSIYVDFSLFKRYTDENELHQRIIFIRNDYFGTKDKNYFQASTTTPIVYDINQDEDSSHQKALRFFLQNIFGKEKQDFRDGQLPIIANALKMRESTVGLLPTGGGKSLCYQLPCLLQPSINFVVCPIKSLMSDQKDNLDKLLIDNASYISSDIEDARERELIQTKFSQGRFLFVWISPERFQIPTFRAYLDTVVSKYNIAYAVIDEVHCMSEWGHDFRTSYLNLVRTIREKCEGAKIIGLTATASKNVLTDIAKTFGIEDRDRNDIKSKLDFSRKELEFHIIKDEGNKYDCLQETMKSLEKGGFMLDEKQAGLIFTPHVNGELGCYYLSNRLNGKYKDKVKWYSGSVPTVKGKLHIEPNKQDKTIWEIYLEKANKKITISKHSISDSDKIRAIIVDLFKSINTPILDDEVLEREVQAIVGSVRRGISQVGMIKSLGKSEADKLGEIPVMSEKNFTIHKKGVQKDFKDNKFPLIVATKAFGMGIDKNNIHYTFHYGLPASLESLYQEAGRAGRWDDKEQKAHCYVLYSQVVDDEKGLLKSIFAKETLPEDVQKLQKEGRGQGDVFTQMFLFASKLETFENEAKIITHLIDKYISKGKTEIHWKELSFSINECINRDGINIHLTKTVNTDGQGNIIQRCIYRLQILGIVKDWTVDFKDSVYVLVLSEYNSKSIEDNLLKHIGKYTVGKKEQEIRNEIEEVGNISSIQNLPEYQQNKEQFKSIYYLLQWTWDAIAYNRRKSLQDMMILCDKNLSSEEFKRAIDQVFQITEITFIIQYISQKEGIDEYNKWFEVLYTEKKNEKDIPEYMPAIQDIKRRKGEFERLQRNMSSYMQSYRDNYALNFISGITQLFLNEYDKQDGKINLESALQRIKGFSNEKQNYILNQLIGGIGRYLPAQNQEELVESILLHYPERLEDIAEKYDMPWLLTEKLIPKLQRFQTLNQQYYEQIGKI